MMKLWNNMATSTPKGFNIATTVQYPHMTLDNKKTQTMQLKKPDLKITYFA